MPLGQSVLDALGDAFDRIRAADAVLSQSVAPSLHIVASYSVAILWLSPRLSRFQARHPGVRLYLDPLHNPLVQPQADITILHAAKPPDPVWVPLFTDRCAAVARAGHPLFERSAGLAEVLHGRLVHVSQGKAAAWDEFSWQQWAKFHLLQHERSGGPTVTAEHMAVDMVLAEEAFALVSMINASHLIRKGRLGAWQGSDVATGSRFWLRNPAGGDMAADFQGWIEGELAATA